MCACCHTHFAVRRLCAGVWSAPTGCQRPRRGPGAAAARHSRAHLADALPRGPTPTRRTSLSACMRLGCPDGCAANTRAESGVSGVSAAGCTAGAPCSPSLRAADSGAPPAAPPAGALCCKHAGADMLRARALSALHGVPSRSRPAHGCHTSAPRALLAARGLTAKAFAPQTPRVSRWTPEQPRPTELTV